MLWIHYHNINYYYVEGRSLIVLFAFKAEQGKSDMEETISELKDLKTNLERQVAELRAKAEQVERRATELRQAEEKKHAEEIDFLKKTNQQLKVSRHATCFLYILYPEQRACNKSLVVGHGWTLLSTFSRPSRVLSLLSISRIILVDVLFYFLWDSRPKSLIQLCLAFFINVCPL